ncbi:DUF1573 domain-containing protein [Puteibacter caeruleilacunae]|nr:DUF1573 domain-containing protein [Puteibacter caeruleilacunae]
MRMLILIGCFLLCLSCTYQPVKNDAQVKFASGEYDFHHLKMKDKAECEFEFSNVGESLLVIYDVKTTCGCTVPDWNKKPIVPGKKGAIKIKYDTDHPGKFRKTITVYYNGKDSPKKLVVRGIVDFPKDEEQF